MIVKDLIQKLSALPKEMQEFKVVISENENCIGFIEDVLGAESTAPISGTNKCDPEKSYVLLLMKKNESS